MITTVLLCNTKWQMLGETICYRPKRWLSASWRRLQEWTLLSFSVRVCVSIIRHSFLLTHLITGSVWGVTSAFAGGTGASLRCVIIVESFRSLTRAQTIWLRSSLQETNGNKSEFESRSRSKFKVQVPKEPLLPTSAFLMTCVLLSSAAGLRNKL